MLQRSSGLASNSGRRLAGDAGSVTAELAASLPVFVLLLGLLASVAAGQVMRVNMVVAAADAARAKAVGEPFSPPAGVRLTFAPREQGFVCATAASKLRLLVLAGNDIELAEQACAKQLGQ